MMRPLSRTVLFSLLSAGVLPFSTHANAQQGDNQQVASTPMEDVAVARRKIAVRDAMMLVQQARNAYAAGRYTEAEEHYRSALAVLPKAPATERQQAFIRQSLADALIAKAMDYRKVGRSEEAAEFLKEALQLDPANARAKNELDITLDPTRTNPALSPEHVGNVGEVQRLLELAYGYYELGEFDKAKSTFEAVLRLDPYNSAARQGIERVEIRRSRYYQGARDAYRAKAMADVDEQWEEDVPEPEALPEFGSVGGGENTVDDSVKKDISERLSEMIIPTVVFDDAGIDEVVSFLQGQILRCEASANNGRHINLTSNFGNKNTPAYQQLMGRTIRLNLNNVSVKDVLDLLTQQMDVQYFYTELGVELCLSGRDSGPLMDRVFVVPPHFFDPQDDDADEEEDGDGFAANSVRVKRVNPKQALMKMGITFPEGSYVGYTPSTRLLRVRNTVQNLEDIAAAVDVPMEKDSQVVLSVIAVEVSEDTLDQLGFDWLFNFSVGKKGKTYMSGGQGQGQQIVSDGTGAPVITASLGTNNSPYMTSGLRDAGALKTSTDLDSLIESGSVHAYHQANVASSPAIFGVRGVWSVADVTFVMRGLAQKKGADILQNPKIVFSPGNEEQVAFGCVQEMFFPETWEAGEIQHGNNNRNGNDEFSFSPIATSSHPTDFVRMGCVDDEIDGIGTTLVVHSAELEETEQGTFINISMTTTIKEFEGFINWGSPINSGVINQRGDFQFIQLTPNYILQPMIKLRMENTQIRIAPGSVIVLGGLREARSVQFEDKIPVLGDLPLVGRLFRSSGESKMRKALIFFVKVDFVDPTGRDVRTGERPSMSEQ